MQTFLKKYLLKITIGIILLATIGISIQKLTAPTNVRNGYQTTSYNNYLIFKTSAEHLWNAKDLYKLHPADHFDYYKYSPAFAMFMTPFKYLPNWLGLVLWNLLNVWVLIMAVKSLPKISNLLKAGILLVGLLEQIGATMNSQSNVLMVGLMILSVTNMENRRPFSAAFFLMASVYIKVFSVIIGIFFLFYKKKGSFIVSAIVWFAIMAFLPALIQGWEYLQSIYISWWELLNTDFDNSTGYSVAGILHRWFQFEPSKMAITIAGAVLFLIPLYRVNKYNYLQYRMLYLANALIWVIIFNHKVESPTFIIAITGIAIWFWYIERSVISIALLVFSLLFVSVVYSDAMPIDIRNNFFHYYVIKALPCIIVWLAITYKLAMGKIVRIYGY